MSDFHIYGQNIAEFYCNENIQEVIKWFEKQKMIYSLWYVPVPKDASYEIEFYQPKVAGAKYLGSFKNKKLV